MNLDCHTPKGKTYIQKQHETGLLIESFFNIKIKHATYDAEKHDSLMYKDGKLVGVCEIKSRDFFSRDGKSDFTLARLKNGGYLITADKLDHLQAQSREKKVTSYVFVNALRDHKLLCFKIANPNGDFICNFTRDRTVTKNTCNDYKGNVKRVNAFIPVVNNSSFKYFDLNQKEDLIYDGEKFVSHESIERREDAIRKEKERCKEEFIYVEMGRGRKVYARQQARLKEKRS